MINSEDVKILIVDVSVVESTTLLIFLSPLTKRITCCLDYSQALSTFENATENKNSFDLLFLALPPVEHSQYETAIKLFAASLQGGNPLRTIILGGDKLPSGFNNNSSEEQNVLIKPITKDKLQEVLTPLNLNIPTMNCWEYLRCGREEGGDRCKELGICPTAVESAANGLHGGTHGGRSCWAIAGTLCGGVEQGSYCSKIENCMQCDFYKLVQNEEGDHFESIDSITSRLNRNRR